MDDKFGGPLCNPCISHLVQYRSTLSHPPYYYWPFFGSSMGYNAQVVNAIVQEMLYGMMI